MAVLKYFKASDDETCVQKGGHMEPNLMGSKWSVFLLIASVVFFEGCRAVSSDLTPAPAPAPTATPSPPSGPSEDAVDFG